MTGPENELIEIPNGATNKDALKAVFPNINFNYTFIGGYLIDGENVQDFKLSTTKEWLNKPYKGGNKQNKKGEGMP